MATDTPQPAKNAPLLLLVLITLLLGIGIGIATPQGMIRSMITKNTIKLPEQTAGTDLSTSYGKLQQEVVPAEGYTVRLDWGDTGGKLVEAGGIDLARYQEIYADEALRDELSYLTGAKQGGITITPENAHFWVNTLWALGLSQQSDVLDNGIMGTQYKDTIGNFASTGGWTLGSKDAVTLYSSSAIIPLTADQQRIVTEISSNIYRPCCGNPTSFPDCNHGMAILGLVELMVSQNFSEEEIYHAALAFNSYWFPQTYIDLAYFFQTTEQAPWRDVDAKRALSKDFSSAGGYASVKQQIGTIPGNKTEGGSCSA